MSLFAVGNCHLPQWLTPSKNVPCKAMESYMPPSVSESYNVSKHNGTWYEVAFRDLYPWGPVCDCQQSIKYVNKEKGYIDDYFVFSCYPLKLNYISPQRENLTRGDTGEQHKNGMFDMYVAQSDFDFITHYEWNSMALGFKDDGRDQYKWVIEFQCGTRPQLPRFTCPTTATDGECYFTGIQMFVRDRDFIEQGREEMLQYVHSLGPESSSSERVDWVLDDFHGGTFPLWFKNVTWRDDCPMPCSSGVFNETTGMWGCPPERADRIAKPIGAFPVTQV